MARRGFLAEIAHQQKVAARQAANNQRAAVRAHNDAIKAHNAAVKAELQAKKASIAEKKLAIKETEMLHIEEMKSSVAEKNAELQEKYDSIDTLLESTLHIDDYVDLESFKVDCVHPVFRHKLETPIPKPSPLTPPTEPIWTEPDRAKGFLKSKKKHEEARLRAWQEFRNQYIAWQEYVSQIPALQLEQLEKHNKAEYERKNLLAIECKKYEEECTEREKNANESNKVINKLIEGLSEGSETSVQDYVEIVLGNSVYPEGINIDYDHEYNSDLSELIITVEVPSPEEIPTIKAYKYTKSSDEITYTNLTQTEIKKRYKSMISQVAVRTLHEIFEADRQGLIQSVSLSVGTNSIDPAIGQIKYIPLIIVASSREAFIDFDLSNVIPEATIEHLGGLISKNPIKLQPVNNSKGVRNA